MKGHSECDWTTVLASGESGGFDSKIVVHWNASNLSTNLAFVLLG